MAGKKHLTSRDVKLINFLEDTSLLITAKQAAMLFYKSPTNNVKSSITVAQNRLKVAHELKQIKRYRDHIDQSFVYYAGSTKVSFIMRVKNRLKSNTNCLLPIF